MQHYEKIQVLGEVVSPPVQREDEYTLLTLKVSIPAGVNVSRREHYYNVLFPATTQQHHLDEIEYGNQLQVAGTLQLDVMNDCNGSPTCVAFINVEEYALVQSLFSHDEDDYDYHSYSNNSYDRYDDDDGLDGLRDAGYTEDQIWACLGD